MDEIKMKEHKEKIKALRNRLPWHYTPLVKLLYPQFNKQQIQNVVQGVSLRPDILKALEHVADKFGSKEKTLKK